MTVIGDLEIQKAIASIKQRSEKQRDLQKLIDSFVDLGIIPQIASENNQVVYGRRGTGKTHLFGYLASELKDRPNVAVISVDCRTLGSSRQFSDPNLAIEARCLALFRDILAEVHDGLLEYVVEHPTQYANEVLAALSDLERSTLEPVADRRTSAIETTAATSTGSSKSAGIKLEATGQGANLNASTQSDRSLTTKTTESVAYSDKVVFPNINRILQDICKRGDVLPYLLLDEWSSLPLDIQPYLAEFLKRGFLPLNLLTVKIASLEVRSNFSFAGPNGIVGIEPGADMATGLDLDDHYVYDRNPDRVAKAFANILFKHIQSELPDGYLYETYGVDNGDKFVKTFFTNSTTAFHELARAAEGVVRDLLNIFMHAFFASQRKDQAKIDKRTIIEAAQQWFEQDKARELAPAVNDALQRIVREVIGNRSSRSFLVPRELEKDDLLQSLFDARVIHLVKRGYADKDNPGVRYNIYTLDYGTYVDYLGTSKAPTGFEEEAEASVEAGFIVPFDDKRKIRRIILTKDVLHPTGNMFASWPAKEQSEAP